MIIRKEENMKVATFIKAGQMSITEAPKPKIERDTDAIIRVVRACVCGSDLWWYRGISQKEPNSFAGHEAIGIVEEVGSAVTHVKPGDFVIVPFTHGCGECEACRAGFDGNCLNQERGLNIGYQGEYIRFTHAHWALVKIPGQPSDYTDLQLNSFLSLSDVMATGYHAAKTAEVKEGDTVVVIGDGAVGLCGVIGAKLLGAKKIIAMSKYADKQALAKEFGATDIISERGDDAVEKIKSLTNGAGADAILECVGTKESVQTAINSARPGAVIGRVGVPHIDELDTNQLFWKNIGLRGGVASVTTFDRECLLDAVLSGDIEPGKVFTHQFSLDDVQAAYQAMDKRDAIKSLIVVS